MLYKYNHDGELVGVFPSNPDGYIPDGFTEVPPLNEKKGFWIRWNGTKWERLKDWSNTIVYSIKDGSKVTWQHKYKYDELLYVEEPPPNDKSRWNGERWVYNSKKNRLQAKIDKLGHKVLIKGETAWDYDLNAQHAYQLAENQRKHTGNRCIVFDAFGTMHNLHIRSLNNLQRDCYMKYIKEKGY